jgi:hypothetical protein
MRLRGFYSEPNRCSQASPASIQKQDGQRLSRRRTRGRRKLEKIKSGTIVNTRPIHHFRAFSDRLQLYVDKLVVDSVPSMSTSKDMGAISFGYLPESPLLHRWRLVSKDKPFEASASRDRPAGLTVKAEDAIDYDVEKYQRICNRVEFAAKLSEHSYAYAKVQLVSRDGETVSRFGWIAVDVGDMPPRKVSRDEWVIYRKSNKDGWANFDLLLPEEVGRTFGQTEGLQFSELLGFRLRGEVSISPISLFHVELETKLNQGGVTYRETVAPRSELTETVPARDTKRWTRAEKWTAAGTIAGIVAIFVAVLFPEIRKLVHLEKAAFSQSSSPSNLSSHDQPVYEPLQVVTAKDFADLRRLSQVALIRESESGKTLSEIPPGSFGFTLASEIVEHGLGFHPELDVNSSALPNEFEIHKLRDGTGLLVGCVGPETLSLLQEGLQPKISFSIYTGSWKEAAKFVGVSLSQITCARSRDLSIEVGAKQKYVGVLDCQRK